MAWHRQGHRQAGEDTCDEECMYVFQYVSSAAE